MGGPSSGSGPAGTERPAHRRPRTGRASGKAARPEGAP